MVRKKSINQLKNMMKKKRNIEENLMSGCIHLKDEKIY